MMRKNKKISCAILIIGNEILSGRTRDQNVFFSFLVEFKLGIHIAEVRIVPDMKNN